MAAHIFRSYDIRGLYRQDISEDSIEGIGNVLAQYSDADIVTGIDMRSSSRKLEQPFIKGVTDAGKNVFDLGLIPLGTAMFHAWKNRKTLAYLTASHLPKEWAGVKFFHPDGTGFMDKENYKLRDMFLGKSFVAAREKGKTAKADSAHAMKEYVMFLLSKLKIRKKISVSVDCGNGMACLIAPRLFGEAGCDVKVIYGSLSENMERNPEPNADPLTKLRENVEDIGIAYDGDADRMILVSDKGEILAPEKSSFLILSQLMKETEGPVIANVECSRVIDKITQGRKVIRVPVGHTFLAKYAHENHACFGMESSGHYILPSLVPFDDALAVSLYACYALSESGKKLSDIVRGVPSFPSERINMECREGIKFRVVEQLKEKLSGEYGSVNTMDGVRVDFREGWILIRASNTSPLIRLTVEADNERELKKLREKFSAVLSSAISGLA